LYNTNISIIINLYNIFVFILGDCTGNICTWQLDQKIEMCHDTENVLTLNSKMSAHNDCINGVRLVITQILTTNYVDMSSTFDLIFICNHFLFIFSLHPTRPLLATASGQRHYEFDNDEQALKRDTDISLKLWKII